MAFNLKENPHRPALFHKVIKSIVNQHGWTIKQVTSGKEALALLEPLLDRTVKIWDLEAGAIIRMTGEKHEAAPFFQKIRDYPEGFRIFGAPLATERRLAIAMGMDPDSRTSNILVRILLRDHLPAP